jgi:glycerol-3-phosphate acyltransferase PlsY
MNFVFFALAAYLLGAVPFGLLIGLALGKDVRKLGSGNIGATNVGRVVGRRWGHLCLLLDIAKGFLPTLAVGLTLVPDQPEVWQLAGWLAVGIAAVLGHTFPVWLGFRGGKGVATTIGVALGVFPYYTVPIAAALMAYFVVRVITGYVSPGSLALAVAFPIAFWVYVLADPRLTLERLWPLQAVAILLGLLIVIRHAGNIARLLQGKEQAVTGAAPKL